MANVAQTCRAAPCHHGAANVAASALPTKAPFLPLLVSLCAPSAQAGAGGTLDPALDSSQSVLANCAGFIGMAGVYDLEAHLLYEKQRHVHTRGGHSGQAMGICHGVTMGVEWRRNEEGGVVAEEIES